MVKYQEGNSWYVLCSYKESLLIMI